MNTKMKSLDGFQKSLRLCSLDENRISIGSVNSVGNIYVQAC